MNSADIVAKISVLKKNKGQYFSNSCILFSQYPDKEWEVLETEQSLIIIITEKEIKRIVFYTVNFEDLKQLIQNVGENVVIEVISKDKNYLKDAIERIGFKKLITQVKISCKKVSEVFDANSEIIKFYNPLIGELALESDADEINDILWSTFDTRSSHLKTKAELSKQIARGEFYVHRNENNRIDMLIQQVSSLKAFYFNQVINKGDKTIFHALTINLLKRYCDNGGEYVYAWVNEDNVASFKYFSKYKLMEDGIYNSIYYN